MLMSVEPQLAFYRLWERRPRREAGRATLLASIGAIRARMRSLRSGTPDHGQPQMGLKGVEIAVCMQRRRSWHLI